MQKKDFEAVADALKRARIKTTAAIKDLLREADEKNENAALAGKRLTARARVSALFDEGTFVEVGAFIKRRATEFDPDAVSSDDFEAVICGYGAIGGKLAYAFAQDYYRSKGAVGEAHAKKICSLYDMAIKNGAPVIGIFDSCGAFILEGVSALAGYGKIMSSVSAASGVIPQIAIVTGTCAGSAAAIASMFDFTVVSKANGKIYADASSQTSAGNAAKSGVVALETEDEISAICEAKRLISLLPSNNCDGTVRFSDRSSNANGAVDVSFVSDGGYDAKRVIEAVVDDGKYMELYSVYAPELVFAIAPVGGIVSGIIASNPAVNDGILTSDAIKKAARAVSFCDSYNIPVITLVDCAGIEQNESSALPGELAKLAFAYTTAGCPKVTVVTGAAYGAAFILLGSKSIGADIVFALSSAKIGAMNAEAAVALLWDEKFDGAKDPAAKRLELTEQWNATFGSAVDAAYKGELDDIIEASELRARIAAALEMLSMKNAGEPGRRHANLPL